MSVCNLVVQTDAAYLVTDSGYFDSAGKIVRLLPKSIIFPEVPVAIAAVGAGALVLAEAAYEAPEQLSGGKFTLDRFRDLIRGLYARRGYDPRDQYTRWAAAYYSRHHGRAVGYSFSTHPDDGAPGESPWKWYPSRVLVMPYVAPVAVWGDDRKVSLSDPNAFNVKRDAMKFVDAQRRHREWGNSKIVCGVAGEIRLTKVSAAGIEEWQLHDYADRVGKLAGAVLPA